MTVAQIAHNHQIDPTTGFIESPAYPDSFDAEKKSAMIEILKNGPFRLEKACKSLGVHYSTFTKAWRNDPLFRESIDEAKRLHIEAVEQVLATQALEPKSVVDRIFFLKCWKPDRYNPVMRTELRTEISIDVRGLDAAIERQKVMDTQLMRTESGFLT